jgi:hypothetical protein
MVHQNWSQKGETTILKRIIMKGWNPKHQGWQWGYCHVMEIVFYYKHWYIEISVQHSRKRHTTDKNSPLQQTFITIMLIHFFFTFYPKIM